MNFFGLNPQNIRRERLEHLQTLDLRPDASWDEIKRRHRKLSKIYHPDIRATGDVERFRTIQEAYEWLKNHSDNGGRGQPEKRQSPATQFLLRITLGDSYNGKHRELRVTRDRECPKCEGRGARAGTVLPNCQNCNGRGTEIILQNLGHFRAQMQQMCHMCEGEGVIIDPKDACPKCDGSKLIKNTKMVDVYIDRGMTTGDSITLHGEADQKVGMTPGDLIIKIHEKPHKTFKRSGNTLYMKQKIGLLEALSGTKFEIKHLDGRRLAVQSEPNEIISPGTLRTIKNEGMPERGNIYEKGNLIIQFDVTFPKNGSLSDPKVQKMLHLALEDSCPKLRSPSNGAEFHKMTKFDEEEEKHEYEESAKRARARQGGATFAEDDDENIGGCHMQ